MTQTHKIRPAADRLVEWSAEEMQRMRAVMRSCLGFIESRYPGEQPCYEDTLSQPMRYANRWYYDNAPAQQEEPAPDRPRAKKQQKAKKRKTTRGILEEHDAELRKMCADPALSCEKIGKHFGVNASTVAKYTRRHGIRRAWSKTARGYTQLMLNAHREEIRQWLREGRQQTWIAEQLGVNAPSLNIYIHSEMNM